MGQVVHGEILTESWNFAPEPSDTVTVLCDDVRESLSAELDAEQGVLSPETTAAHLSECAGCRNWVSQLEVMRRSTRLQQVEMVPDLTETILLSASTPRRVAYQMLRVGLAAVAVAELAAARNEIFPSAAPHDLVHVSRHAGTLALGLAVGLLYVAWRPFRAAALLPVMTVVAVVTTVVAVLDVRSGHAFVLSELHHVGEAVALWLLWRLCGKPLPRAPRVMSLRRRQERSRDVDLRRTGRVAWRRSSAITTPRSTDPGYRGLTVAVRDAAPPGQ